VSKPIAGLDTSVLNRNKKRSNKWNAYVSLHINVLWNVLNYNSKYNYPLVTCKPGEWK